MLLNAEKRAPKTCTHECFFFLSKKWIGALRIETSYYPTTLECLLERRLEKKDVSGAAAFLDLLLRMHPEDRARPEAVIDHPWFTE